MGVNYGPDDEWPELNVQDDEPNEVEQGDAGEMMAANPILQVQAKHEIQSAIIVAKRFERKEDRIYQKFVHGSCKRLGFAMTAEYAFKRGKKKDDSGKYVDNIIQGPTVKAARELARLWGNIRYGAVPIGESDDKRQILAYAWDLETNTWIQQGDLFEKLVEKKDGWVEPDERELRELSNRRSAIGIRNCLLMIVPPDFMEDGLAMCKETIKAAMADPNSDQFKDVKKRIIAGFSNINVPVDELEQYIGHALASCDSNELETLRGIYTAIKDGHTSWANYRKAAGEAAVQGLPTEIRRPGAVKAEPPKTPPTQPQAATVLPAVPKSQPSPSSSATATPTAPTAKNPEMTKHGMQFNFE